MIANISNLYIPKWYFGRSLTKEEELRFHNCIVAQGGYGVITIATSISLPSPTGKKFCIVDGVKRFQWVKRNRSSAVRCDYIGERTDSDMILASYRLNFGWKSIDIIKFAELLKEIVMPSFEHPHILANQFPDEYKDIDRLLNLLKFDWSQFDKEKVLTSFF